MTDEVEESSSLNKQPTFQLDLHAWIESQQTAHGVRHDDYGQYQAYCTRRLSRISHHPNAKQYLVCSSKYATATTTTTPSATTTTTSTTSTNKQQQQQRSRHAYRSRKNDTFANNNDDSNNNSNNPNPPQHESVLWYLVVSAERCWAYANLIKRQRGRRQLVLRKLKKAKGWADKLRDMASCGSTDDITYLECQAYASWMTANLALEQFDYVVRFFFF